MSRYAFIEFRSAIEATKGLALDGTSLQGQTLRFNRSNEFEGPVPPEMERLMIPAGLPQQARICIDLESNLLLLNALFVTRAPPKAQSG